MIIIIMLINHIDTNTPLPGIMVSASSTLSTMQHFEFGSKSLPTYKNVGMHHRPVLVLWGDKDLTCPFSGAAALERLLLRATVVGFEGLGHSMPLEADGAVAAEVAKFIGAVLR